VSRTCTVCSHPKVSEINQALLGNESYRSIAKHFGASQSAMYRHQQEHLPQALVKAKDALEVLSADNLLARVGELEADARRIAAAAEASGDLKIALGGIREMVRIVELMAKLTGRLDGKPANPAGIDNRKVIFNFPVASPELLAEVANAPTIDLPAARPRLLTRPSDGKPL
jgi:uncharacterized small protein (DUF1192 family)